MHLLPEEFPSTVYKASENQFHWYSTDTREL